jgi:peroxiredoxin
MPGEPFPGFSLPDESDAFRSLDEFLSDGPVAVVFDRGHWCPYCRINMAALREAHDRIRAMGGQLVVISPDRQMYLAHLKQDSRACFPILSDIDNGYAMSIGLAFFMGAELKTLYTEFGNHFDEYQGNSAGMIPIPATFVIATDGTVAARFIEPDYRRRMAIDDLIEAVANATQARRDQLH